MLCSPRLSWVICFAAARLLPNCRGARGFPGRCTPAARQGCPARATSLKLEVDLICTWPQRAHSGPVKQVQGHLQGKEQWVPTPLCYKDQAPTLAR